MRIRYSEASVKYPVRVSWKCSKCGHQTKCNGELRISVTGSDSENAGRYLLHNVLTLITSNDNSKRKIKLINKYLFTKIDDCEKCHHKELWQWRPGCLLAFVGLLLTFIVSFAILGLTEKGFLAGLFISIPVLFITGLIPGMVAVRTPEESLPKIALIDDKPEPVRKETCPNCGRGLKNDSIYCSYCGKKISGSSIENN